MYRLVFYWDNIGIFFKNCSEWKFLVLIIDWYKNFLYVVELFLVNILYDLVSLDFIIVLIFWCVLNVIIYMKFIKIRMFFILRIIGYIWVVLREDLMRKI